MADPREYTIMEERQEQMVSPRGENSTRRVGHFLKPSVTTIEVKVFNLPSDSLSSATPTSQAKKSTLKVEFNGWKGSQDTWIEWVNHMYPLHQEAWKRAGIHDAILSTTNKIRSDHDLVCKVAEKWCPETNTFVFPFGESTITLEDMIVLGGYSVLGNSVLCSFASKEKEEIRDKLLHERLKLGRSSSKKAAQAAWIKKFKKTGNQIEHEAFLAAWLSRFVFPSRPIDTVGKHVFSIAILLASGNKIALAPAVLASLYKDLKLLKQRIVTVSNNLETNQLPTLVLWAPFQLIQIWVWERFSNLRPSPKSIRNGLPRLAKWDKAKKLNPGLVGNVILWDRKCFRWRPYAMDMNNRLFHKFYSDKEEWLLIGSGLDEDFESFARCMRVCELIGFGCIEQYLPHRVAMQFGMDQDLPGFVARANATLKIAWKNYTRPITGEKLYIPSRFFKSAVTTRYLYWWESSVVKRVVKIGDRERENHYGNLQSVERLMNLGKMVGTGELVVERSDRVVVGENVSGAENTEIVSEIEEQELEARLTRLEIKLAKLKEERLGRSLESKSAEGS
ncbi:hypothetical protein CsSME_00034518 [Camellia sinensis var. sinensis]